MTMKLQVGTYHFGRHRSHWGIYICRSVEENGTTISDHIGVAFTYEEAVREVYRLNGWGEPKKIYRKY